jgi:hypothetical protein
MRDARIMRARLLLFLASVLFSAILVGHAEAGLIESEFKPFEEGNFIIKRREMYQHSFWVVEQFVNKIIGYALYDEVRRRFRLFDLTGRYAGFLQATLVDFKPDKLFKQYLWYGRDNRYRGVFIRNIGGRALPYEPRIPPQLRYVSTGPPPGTYGFELGGELQLVRAGNIPLELPPEMEISVFPDLVDQAMKER